MSARFDHLLSTSTRYTNEVPVTQCDMSARQNHIQDSRCDLMLRHVALTSVGDQDGSPQVVVAHVVAHVACATFCRSDVLHEFKDRIESNVEFKHRIPFVLKGKKYIYHVGRMN